MILLTVFILGVIAPFVFVFGAAGLFLALPGIYVWQRFSVSQRWRAIPKETRHKIVKITLLSASVLTWALMLKGT